MLIYPEWVLFALALAVIVLGTGLSLGVVFAVCVWKPEHAYTTLLRVRRFFVRPHPEVTAWSIE